MKLLLWNILQIIVVLCLTTRPSSSCHPAGRKRYAVNLEIEDFFPACMRNRFARDKYGSRNWRGAVSFLVFHSEWYSSTNTDICRGDSVGCWLESLNNVIDPHSPALPVAKSCVVDYHNAVFRRSDDFYRPKSNRTTPDSGACTVVNATVYKEDFKADLENVEFASCDASLSDLDDVIDFVQNDMLCPSCSCDNIFDNDEYFEEFQLNCGKSCGDCWATRLATSLAKASNLRKTASRNAVKLGGLNQVSRCPPPSIDTTDISVVKFIGYTLVCGKTTVTVRIDTCDLHAYGYKRADQFVIANPYSTANLHRGNVEEQCIPVLKPKVDGTRGKVAVFHFERTRCGAQPQHGRFRYAVRNMEPKFLYRKPNALPDIYIQFSCPVVKNPYYPYWGGMK